MKIANNWITALKFDPVNYILSTNDPVLAFHANTLLVSRPVDPSDSLWRLPEVAGIIDRQQKDGSWKYKGNRPGDVYGEKYELLETWKNLRILVEKFGFDSRHSFIKNAVNYIFSCQTDEGDIRGILSNQYTPYYMGAMLEIINKAGFSEDTRVEKAFNWLASMRQEDGGWIIPINMYKMSEYRSLCQEAPILPDRTLAFSHMATGMVLRAYAAHPLHRHSKDALHAGNLMKKRLFKKDAFTFRQAVAYWYKFQYTFWWADLVSVIDSLVRIGFTAADKDIQRGIGWFVENQQADGCWKASYGGRGSHADAWVTLAICRVLKGFLG